MSTSIDFDEYKRLKVLVAILPFCIARRMHFAAVEDLARRGIQNQSFLIDGTGALIGDDPEMFVSDAAERADLAHLFQRVEEPKAALADTILGIPKGEFDKLKPEHKLRKANEHAAAEKREKRHATSK